MASSVIQKIGTYLETSNSETIIDCVRKANIGLSTVAYYTKKSDDPSDSGNWHRNLIISKNVGSGNISSLCQVCMLYPNAIYVGLCESSTNSITWRKVSITAI